MGEGCCCSSCDRGKQSQLLIRPIKGGSGLQVQSGVWQHPWDTLNQPVDIPNAIQTPKTLKEKKGTKAAKNIKNAKYN